ncbi:hypothetical protein GGD53_005459 [Rhizobium aethiopicum]|uniref:Uncharacterized protein n=1 Tax=Rhizobium aethiopicum TaxID=1138170 RepID=A0A7W6VS81_9HYPH|nr:hypothetical protein [Rhizobium aethiopicum]
MLWTVIEVVVMSYSLVGQMDVVQEFSISTSRAKKLAVNTKLLSAVLRGGAVLPPTNTIR